MTTSNARGWTSRCGKTVERNADTLEEEEKDTIGAKYLKVVNSVSFSDISIYTVKLSVS